MGNRENCLKRSIPAWLVGLIVGAGLLGISGNWLGLIIWVLGWSVIWWLGAIIFCYSSYKD